MADCPSRFTLVRLRAGDLPGTEGDLIEAHLGGCGACRARMAEIERNVSVYASRQDEHLDRLRAHLATEQTEARRPVRSPWLRLAPAAGALALAAAVALFVLPGARERAAAPETAAIRFKGAMAFEAVARRGKRQFRLEPGAALRPGDAIRFVVTTGSPGFISVFSIDALQRVSPFYPDSDPETDPRPMPVAGSGRHELPGSVILDESVGDECLVVAFSKTPFDRRELHRKALGSDWFRSGGAPEAGQAGEGIVLQTLRVRKTR